MCVLYVWEEYESMFASVSPINCCFSGGSHTLHLFLMNTLVGGLRGCTIIKIMKSVSVHLFINRMCPSLCSRRSIWRGA